MNDIIAQWYRDIPFMVPALKVITALTLLLVVASAVTRRLGAGWARGANRRVTDVYEVAFLSGGPARVADTAIDALHPGIIDIAPPGIAVRRKRRLSHPVTRAVLEQADGAETLPLAALRRSVALSPAVQAIGDDLAARGLLARPSRARRVVNRWARLQHAGLLCCLPVSFVLTFVTAFGMEIAGVPFLFLTLPVLIPAAIVAHRCAVLTRGRITPAGRRALRRYVREPGLGRRAGVALNGPRAAGSTIRSSMVAAAAVPIAGVAVDAGASGGGGAGEVNWCGGDTGDSGCGGSSCGGGGSACGGGSGGGGGGSSCGGSSGGGGFSCGGSSSGGGGSSCGGGGGGSACASVSV
ncbi:TIGR04222 domain-containing membrane protein [Streptomyces sp. NPDC020875]|uniref:TIGR04222 domain-containing membrane protein n=1 Tax=Streptomyces sp. NPDC020875 TaxID=3154898 RepID=UPI0033DE5D1F